MSVDVQYKDAIIHGTAGLFAWQFAPALATYMAGSISMLIKPSLGRKNYGKTAPSIELTDIKLVVNWNCDPPLVTCFSLQSQLAVEFVIFLLPVFWREVVLVFSKEVTNFFWNVGAIEAFSFIFRRIVGRFNGGHCFGKLGCAFRSEETDTEGAYLEQFIKFSVPW